MGSPFSLRNRIREFFSGLGLSLESIEEFPGNVYVRLTVMQMVSCVLQYGY